MQEAREYLKVRIDSLPYEKLGKVLSFIDFVEQEQEPELILSPDDDAEVAAIMEAGDYIDGAEVEAMIEARGDLHPLLKM